MDQSKIAIGMVPLLLIEWLYYKLWVCIAYKSVHFQMVILELQWIKTS